MYAKDTAVSVEKSKAEIERIVSRYGASQFFAGWAEGQAAIGFTMKDRMVKFLLPLPKRDDKEFIMDPRGRNRKRPPAMAAKVWEQACRSRWRSLFLVIKAKLEAVESGITSFEQEFLAHIVLPDGATVGQWVAPQLAEVYETKKMPPLLPGLGSSTVDDG